MVILIVTLVAVLSELGFNVTTIVAGTSVVAAAIAFGTQSIVKDLLSGVFLLVEDQLGVGDYVDMQLASGTVEEIGLRVTSLRADDGTHWYVRNGEVLRLGQLQQGRSRPPEPGRAEPGRADGRARTPRRAVGQGSRRSRRTRFVTRRVCLLLLVDDQSSTRVASKVMVVPVSACETGQFCLASSAAAANCSAVRPGTTAFTVSLIPVMP